MKKDNLWAAIISAVLTAVCFVVNTVAEMDTDTVD